MYCRKYDVEIWTTAPLSHLLINVNEIEGKGVFLRDI